MCPNFFFEICLNEFWKGWDVVILNYDTFVIK